MTINRTSITKFRSIEQTQLNFGPGTNILIGPNGSGKSSVLMALTWGLTGFCVHTSRDGKGAEKLARGGAKDMAVSLEVDGLGRLDRQRAPHTLSLGGYDGKAAVIQDRVYTALKVTSEAIRTLLDPQPLSHRTLPEQKQAMVKILRPPELRPTLNMQQEGISEIHGIEHLNILHKQYKEERLRDINRDGKKAEEAMRRDRPKWPFPGKEESHYTDNGRQLAEIRDTLIAKLAKLSERRDGFVKYLEMTAGRVEEAPSEEAIQAQKKKLDEAEEASITTGNQLRVLEGRLSELITLGHQNKSQLEALKDPVKCPAGDCPILAEHHQQVNIRKAEIVAKDKELSAEYARDKKLLPTVQEAVAAAKKELDAQTLKWGAIGAILEVHRRLKEIGVKDDVELEASIKAIDTEMAKVRDQLSRARGSITRNDEALLRISHYHRENEDISRLGKKVLDLIEEGHKIRDVIKDIETLQKNIVEVGIGGFLEHLHAFTDPFGLGKVTYDWDRGFQIDGLRLDLDSGGRNQMIFEAGFRVAGAKVLGLGFVFIDYVAPLTGENWARLVNELTKSDLQVILTYTAGKPPKIASNGSFKGFWLSLEEGLTKVIEL